MRKENRRVKETGQREKDKERRVESGLGEERKKVKVKREERREKKECQGDNAKGANRVTAVSQSYISFTSAATHHIGTTPDPEQTDSTGRRVTHIQVCASADTHLPAQPTLPLTQPSQRFSPKPHYCGAIFFF